jgi:hypothetical protein
VLRFVTKMLTACKNAMPGEANQCVLRFDSHRPNYRRSRSGRAYDRDINIPGNAISRTYKINVSTQDPRGTSSHKLTIMVDVGDHQLAVNQPFGSVDAGAQPQAALTITPKSFLPRTAPAGSSFNLVTLSCRAGLPSAAQCSFTRIPSLR